MFSELSYAAIKNILLKNVSFTASSCRYFTDLMDYVPSEQLLTLDYFCLPDIWIWDPILTHGPLLCPHCKDDFNKMVKVEETNEWETGTRNSLVPRTLRTLSWYVALVGRMYKCENGHSIISYHAGILQQIKIEIQPFMLGHQIGITNEVFDFIMRTVEFGSLFEAIEKTLYSNFYDHLLRKLKLLDQFPGSEANEVVLKRIYKPLSNDSILKIFLINYERNHERYEKDFDDIICHTISIDHTFKAAANIGFMQGKKMEKAL